MSHYFSHWFSDFFRIFPHDICFIVTQFFHSESIWETQSSHYLYTTHEAGDNDYKLDVIWFHPYPPIHFSLPINAELTPMTIRGKIVYCTYDDQPMGYVSNYHQLIIPSNRDEPFSILCYSYLRISLGYVIPIRNFCPMCMKETSRPLEQTGVKESEVFGSDTVTPMANISLCPKCFRRYGFAKAKIIDARSYGKGVKVKMVKQVSKNIQIFKSLNLQYGRKRLVH